MKSALLIVQYATRRDAKLATQVIISITTDVTQLVLMEVTFQLRLYALLAILPAKHAQEQVWYFKVYQLDLFLSLLFSEAQLAHLAIIWHIYTLDHVLHYVLQRSGREQLIIPAPRVTHRATHAQVHFRTFLKLLSLNIFNKGSATYCLTCNGLYYLSNNSGLLTCPNGTYKNTGKLTYSPNYHIFVIFIFEVTNNN